MISPLRYADDVQQESTTTHEPLPKRLRGLAAISREWQGRIEQYCGASTLLDEAADAIEERDVQIREQRKLFETICWILGVCWVLALLGAVEVLR